MVGQAWLQSVKKNGFVPNYYLVRSLHGYEGLGYPPWAWLSAYLATFFVSYIPFVPFDFQVKFPDNKEQTSKSENFVFARDQEERSEVRSSSKETLQDVFQQLSYTLPTQQHR